MNVYPVFLNNLAGRRVVVFAGGHDAERKTGELLDCGAAVEVIGPEVPAALEAWAAAGRLVWHARPYRRGDLRDAFLAIVTETNPEKTAPIWEEARQEKVLINAMDDVPHCTFVAGSVVRRGPLVMSVSTSGCAPALAVRIRQHLEATFGAEYADFLELLRTLREPMAAHHPGFEERRRRWYALVDSDLLDLLNDGRHDEAHQRLEEIVGPDVAATVPRDLTAVFAPS